MTHHRALVEDVRGSTSPSNEMRDFVNIRAFAGGGGSNHNRPFGDRLVENTQTQLSCFPSEFHLDP